MQERVSQKKQASTQLNDEISNYELYFNSLPFPVVILDTNLKINSSNTSWNALINNALPDLETSGKSILTIFEEQFNISSETKKEVNKRFSNIDLQLINTIEFELNGSYKGEKKTWLLKINALPEKKLCMLCLIDITVQKALLLKNLGEQYSSLSDDEIKNRAQESSNVQKAHDHFTTRTSITAKHFGLNPLSETNPDYFNELIVRFDEMVERSLEFQMYKENVDFSNNISKMASDLGSINVSPKDVIDLYLNCLKMKSKKLDAKQFQYYSAEARLVVLELMGHLVSFYRNYSFGLGQKLP